MLDLKSRFHPTSSVNQERPPSPSQPQSQSQILILRPSLQGGKLIDVHSSDAAITSAPLYTISKSLYKKPHVVLYRGRPESNNPLGQSSYHNSSCNVDLTLHNQALHVKWSCWTTDLVIDCAPPYASPLKWKSRECRGRGLELCDKEGVILARLKTGKMGWSHETSLEIFVDVKEEMRDMILISGMMARVLNTVMTIAVST